MQDKRKKKATGRLFIVSFFSSPGIKDYLLLGVGRQCAASMVVVVVVVVVVVSKYVRARIEYILRRPFYRRREG